MARSRRIDVLLAIALALGLTIAGPGLLSLPAHAEPAEEGLPAPSLLAGASAVVRRDSGCLWLREAPGLDAAPLSCLIEGRSVQLLDGVVEADSLIWQQVSIGEASGWVAASYLEPFVGPPACDVAQANRVPGAGLRLVLAISAERAFVIWGGGSLAGLLTAAEARGRRPTAVWARAPDSDRLIGYFDGAPAFLNRSWDEAFPDGRLAAGSPAILSYAPLGLRTPAPDRTLMPSPAPWAAAPVQAAPIPVPAVTAKAVAVVDEASGAVLYAFNAEQPLPPASLTKIATAIVAIEGADLDAWTMTDVDSRGLFDSTLMGLFPGDCFRLRDLLRGLLLPSGNDAALALARAVAGSDETFVTQMNLRTARLGLLNTHFANPHGLDADGHRASATDLAMLARYAMQLPEFAAIVGAEDALVAGSREILLHNGNRFLTRYPGADGVKTGFTADAGRTIVASAMRDGHRVYVVLLDAFDREEDAARLLDWAFLTFRWEPDAG